MAADPGPVTLEHAGREFRRVGDTGWYMTVCWWAGPGHVVRVRDEPQWHTVRIQVSRGDVSGSGHALRTEADQDLIEEDVNGFLAEAGIPARPRGYVWFLASPPVGSWASLWRVIADNERAIPFRAPAAGETSVAIESAVRRLYNVG
ncbi:DUF5956 family protein [Saccharomonospora sp. CUA-673]|uniref:DUF5956 family protein n=1 Tax=Saccharomonospora sp. CUA-673 TaxID=1904969 RepID=UPI0021019DEB|nr:DUF5956 family protein [Saccharomonospora sp. CUA-673]